MGKIDKPFPPPILVTGSHRSGSTWVGRMIEASPQVAYIHEPFHLNHNLGFCGAQWDYWFQYICADNEANYRRFFEKTARLQYNLIPSWDLLTDSAARKKVLNDRAFFAKKRAAGCRPLLKDPIALFSADWLATQFHMDVIVLIRHPAAFAYSLKKAGWFHDFRHFLDQPLLMRDHLHPFAAEIADFVAGDEKPGGGHGRSILEHAALLWKLIHYRIATYQDQFPGWQFVRHEDLSLDPLTGFRQMFEGLKLEFTDAVQQKVLDYTNEHNPAIEPSLFALKRNSKANAYTWKEKLSPDEIMFIRTQVGELSDRFYTSEEWL
ncbi:MAG: hypothetical protein Fur0046_14320 [Cyanobacteria bacterium J069]|nr:MAG: hypothetical protein D6742_04580 [Cyanobacteria bacterium J069]